MNLSGIWGRSAASRMIVDQQPWRPQMTYIPPQPPREDDWSAFVRENYPGRDPLHFTEADFWADKCYEGW